MSNNNTIQFTPFEAAEVPRLQLSGPARAMLEGITRTPLMRKGRLQKIMGVQLFDIKKNGPNISLAFDHHGVRDLKPSQKGIALTVALDVLATCSQTREYTHDANVEQSLLLRRLTRTQDGKYVALMRTQPVQATRPEMHRAASDCIEAFADQLALPRPADIDPLQPRSFVAAHDDGISILLRDGTNRIAGMRGIMNAQGRYDLGFENVTKPHQALLMLAAGVAIAHTGSQLAP